MGNRWGNNGNSDSLYFLEGSRITAVGDCSHEIKRHLLFRRKVMTDLDNIFKSRDTTLPTNICLAKAMFFPVVIYGCESWVLKNWCFLPLVLNKTLESMDSMRSPWTARRSKEPILKDISTEYSLEALMQKVKFQYLGHLMQRTDSLGKNLDAGKI